MAFTLPDLPYAEDALEPTIDATTMNIHRTKHHQAYVTNLNNAVAGTAWENMSIEDVCRQIDQVPENIRTVVRNNGGGHANHSLFWKVMGPTRAAPQRRAGRGHRRQMGQLRRVQGQVQGLGHRPFRQRLGVAGGQG